MSRLPRLAVGAVHPDTDATAIQWGLLAALERRGLGVQHFLSRACFPRRDGATAITGLASRHLDSWLMSPDRCRQTLLRGMRRADIAVIEGSFAPRGDAAPAGGDLATLCEWLGAPRLAIVDAALLTDCRLPARPDRVDGILLDGVADYGSLCRLQTDLETFWGAPVLGAMGQVAELRAAVGRLAFGQSPGPQLIADLAEAVERFTNVERIERLARKYELHGPEERGTDARGPEERDLAGRVQEAPGHDAHRDEARLVERAPLRIAMACDEVFRCYFPDTLELLEERGATICDFSPLKDERLPPDTDIVYFCCGRPDLFAADLAANTCMISSLREHVCSGRRIYAECGGLAYLSRQIELPDGRRLPMAGALPVSVRLCEAAPPRPIESRLSADCWLGREGAVLRGYLNSRWVLSGADLAPGDASSPFLIARRQAIGSRLHLEFAAHPEALDAFFHPCAAATDRDALALARAL